MPPLPVPVQAYRVALFLLSALALSANAQSITIDGARGPSCSGCTIEMTRVATLGKPDDPEWGAFGGAVIPGRGGQFLLRSAQKAHILVYDSTGRLLRTVGRRGQGPGEFGDIALIAPGLADSLIVHHDGWRISVLTPTLEYARSMTIADMAISASAPLSNGRLVIPNLGRMPGRPRQPLHLVSATGQYVKAFGAERPVEADPNCEVCSWRSVARSRSNGTFWSFSANAYVIEQWDTAGTLRRSISVGGSTWFAPWNTHPQGSPSALRVRPLTKIQSVAEDAQGRVWVGGVGPATNWKADPPPPATVPAPSARAPVPSDPTRKMVLDEKYASVIEVLDPVSRRVVVSRRIEGLVVRLISAEYAYTVREDPTDGFAVFDVWRLQIKSP
jgi:hypothetical protein